MSKTIPPACPEPDHGVRHWRGLDELSGSPAFKELADREFPAGASELTDASTRRDFVKLMGASLAFAGIGLTGCRRPEEKIYPFGRQPEGYIHGVPQFYATAMPTRSGAVPLLVKQQDGRPVKVEGNDAVPGAGGGTDLHAQASILELYDPDRAQRHMRGGNAVSRAAAEDFLVQLGREAAAGRGAGVAFLTNRSSSPSRARLKALLQERLPEAKWYAHEPVDFDVHRAAASAATGAAVRPLFKFEAARAVLSLDFDLLGTEEESHRHARGFAQTRKLTSPHDPMGRLYVVEPLLSVTGANADHRLRVAPGQVLAVAAAIARAVLPEGEVKTALAALPAPAGVDAKWISECAADLVAQRGKAFVVAGHRQPPTVHLIAHALNAALDAFGGPVALVESPAPGDGGIDELARDLNAGAVRTLVILHANPVLDAPADLDWPQAQRKAPTVVRLGYYEDETAETATWHLAAAHYLESWGDARLGDGTLVPVQPLIEPLFGGFTELEVLARIAGEPSAKPYDVARATFFGALGKTDEDAWARFLHDGFLQDSAAKPVAGKLDEAAIAQALAGAPQPAAPSKDALEFVFHRDAKIDDGRHVNNTWLQELPDPITKLVWDNAILISRRTAVELDLENAELADVEVNGRKLTAPVWIVPGMADHTLALSLGYGRQKPGRAACFNGTCAGFNAYPARVSTALHHAAGVKASGTGAKYTLVTTQSHWAMNGRPIVREANLAQFRAKPDFARNFDLDAHFGHVANDPATGLPKRLYPTAFEQHPEKQRSDVHQWGMAVDLSACHGCGACVIACQSENNIPVVGKDQVLRGREMHWLRIDRYFTGFAGQDRDLLRADEDLWRESWIDDPQVVNQPMMCQHCEKAPCESVCPVNATVHDEEGLNIMAYNRCVGTRYCSNNCAWKVRRFNFFDYNKRPINYADTRAGMRGELYKGPFAKRDAAELELVKMAKNPEVTVRMRGVMEKCTFCTQRLEAAKIARKVAAGASGDVRVREGAVQTACQQACPAEAIVFGNLLDPQSRVSRLKQQSRNYEVLGFLDNRARVTYLAKIRNPNPKMPDFREHPLSVNDYTTLNHSDPFAAHDAHGGPGHGAAPEAAAEPEGAH